MIEALRLEWGFEDWKDSRFFGVISEGNISGEKVILLKPTTYMNRSGQSIASIVNFYKLDPRQDVLVISDDIDMEFGKVRFRVKGSHGGQNGLRDTIEKLGTDEFARIKVGIGRHECYSVSDWVLSKFQNEELETLASLISKQIGKTVKEWIL